MGFLSERGLQLGTMSAFENLEALFVRVHSPLRTAMSIFNEHAVRCDRSGIALIVDDERRLLGVITDGDVRRALLAGQTLDDRVDGAMCASPVVARLDTSPHEQLRLFDHLFRHLPLVDEEGRVADLILYSQFTLIPLGSRLGVIRAKTPVRVSLAGGGTDFTRFFGNGRTSAVVSATIDRYCHGTLIPRADDRIILRSEDYGQVVEVGAVEEFEYDGNLDLIKASIRLCQPDCGFELTTRSDVPPGSGLGGSAAMAVTVIGLLNEMTGGRLSDYQIADLAYQAERVELSIAGGWQDQYAAAFGGFNFIEFNDREIVVHPVALREQVILELEENLLLCFTGDTRNSGDAHKSLSDLAPAEAARLQQRSWSLAVEVRNTLVTGRIHEFGTLLEEAWSSKTAPGKLTNKRIEDLIKHATASGAKAGKLLGAGHGGHLLFFCPPLRRQEVVASLEAEGATILEFSFVDRGLRSWQLFPDEEYGVGPASKD